MLTSPAINILSSDGDVVQSTMINIDGNQNEKLTDTEISNPMRSGNSLDEIQKYHQNPRTNGDTSTSLKKKVHKKMIPTKVKKQAKLPQRPNKKLCTYL